MSETRRQLFKTSVMSALGLSAVAGATAGLTATGLAVYLANIDGRSHGGVKAFDAQGPVGATFAMYSGNRWYFFVFTDPYTCTLYETNGPVPQPPGTVLDATKQLDQVTDTQTWFLDLKKAGKTQPVIPLPGQPTLIVTLSNSTAHFSVTVNTSGQLDLPSLQQYYTWMPKNPQIPGSWNEIGSQ